MTRLAQATENQTPEIKKVLKEAMESFNTHIGSMMTEIETLRQEKQEIVTMKD